MRCLIRGVGDVGSAVAHRLFRAGHAVVIHDNSQPTTTRRGMAFADAGEPRAIAGHARDRYVYAPVAGTLLTSSAIGEPVAAGEVIARIDGMLLTAPLSGVVRGLTHDGVPVGVGTKVIEIDPRGDPALVRGIGERPARIADGVLQAIDVARRQV